MKKLAFIITLMSANFAHAAVSIDSGTFTYTQNFNSLTTSTTASAWVNDSTVAGWSLFNSAQASISSIVAGDGSGNTGSFYSFGTTGSTDRALGGTASGGAYFGSPASGSVAGYIAASFTNNTGSTLTGFNIGFDGEQWRNGGNTSTQPMVIQYGFGSSFSSVSSWTSPAGNFDWTSPVATATATAVNGNTTGLVSNRGGSINALSWDNGQTLWLRWIENNDIGNDHGLAIDNFSLGVIAAIPENNTYAMLLAGLGVIGFVTRRRISI